MIAGSQVWEAISVLVGKRQGRPVLAARQRRRRDLHARVDERVEVVRAARSSTDERELVPGGEAARGSRGRRPVLGAVHDRVHQVEPLVVLAALVGLGEAADRRVVALGEEQVEVVLGAVGVHRRRDDVVEEVGDLDLDDARAPAALEVLDRRAHDRVDAGIVAERVGHEADPRAAQRVGVERVAYGRRAAIVAARCRGRPGRSRRGRR